MEPILAIVGPTASGKTALALQWAQAEDGEIISFDSRQVYRHLLIGTAKPAGRWERGIYWVNGIAYHLVDFCEPNQRYSAADFVESAKTLISNILRRGKKPIFVGGTGFYLKAFQNGLAPLPPADAGLRNELLALAEEKGRSHLHAQLAAVDPEAASKIPPNNIARVVRALEVRRLTGRSISVWHREHRESRTETKSNYTLRCVGPLLDRALLHKQIEARCRLMVENGMIEETEVLLRSGVADDCPALTGLGYRSVIAHLRGKLSREQLVATLIQETRQYAKRQLTWFRHQMKVEWVPFSSLTARPGLGSTLRNVG